MHLSVIPGKVEIQGRKADVNKLLASVEPLVNSVKRDVCTWRIDDKRLVDLVAANWTKYMCAYTVQIKWEVEEEEEKGGDTHATSSALAWREHRANRGKVRVRWSYKVR